ncbi:MAG: beta-L-arabinofuranosidase domain-containing protein [Verrucomicrobiota bacterium]
MSFVSCTTHPSHSTMTKITLFTALLLAPLAALHGGEPLSSVRLNGTSLDAGPLQAAMSANVKYLLANSDVDNMLWLFRYLAETPKPPGQKTGWENSYPSHAAQFLMGAGNTLRWQPQPELRQRLNRLIEGIKACQAADGHLLVPGVGNKLDKQWGYSMQMFTHGMVAAARSGNADAYPLLAAAHRYYASLLRSQPPGFALTTDLNYQGHIASLLMHLSPLGTPDDLRLAEQCFVSEPWLEALAARRPEAIWSTSPKWPHCYEIVAFEAYLDHYRATGDQRYLKAMLGAWELIRESWRDVGGTIAICEGQEYPPKCYPLSHKRHVGEFCGSVFWLRFNHRLHQLFPDDERYVDEIEQVIFNAALAAQDPDGQGIHYHLVLEGRKNEGDTFAQGPVPSQRHTCCEGNGTWLYGNLPEYLFSADADGLIVNLYHSATTTWSAGDKPVRVSVQTRFPEDGRVALNVSAAKPMQMVLRLRIPRWCPRDVSVEVDGREAGIGRPGSYLRLDRTWSDGNTVSFHLPLTLRVHRYEGEAKLAGVERYAVLYGPILLACVGPLDGGVPRIAQDPARVSEWLTADPRQPLHFRIRGTTNHYFAPYWRLGHDEPFTCYPVIGR